MIDSKQFDTLNLEVIVILFRKKIVMNYLSPLGTLERVIITGKEID